MGGLKEKTPRLVVRGLQKRYRSTVALRDLSLEVSGGELLGLVGPNGAGKSTTVKIICGQLLADDGHVLIDGHDVVHAPLEAKRSTGYVPQELDLHPFLTGRELLELVAGIRGIDASEAATRIDGLLSRFMLAEDQHRMTREYSEGMARKLAVACALVGDPAVLILDESLSGLDPRAAAEVKAVIRERLEAGTAVVLVSHMLDVVERLCTRIVLVDDGRVVASLGPEAMAELALRGESLESFFLNETQA